MLTFSPRRWNTVTTESQTYDLKITSKTKKVNFRVRAENCVGKSEYSAITTHTIKKKQIIPEKNPPVILEPLQNTYYLKRNESITIEIVLKHSDCEFEWSGPRGVINEAASKDFILSQENFYRRLTISNFKSTYEGKYCFRAFNKDGEDSCTGSVLIRGLCFWSL